MSIPLARRSFRSASVMMQFEDEPAQIGMAFRSKKTDVDIPDFITGPLISAGSA